jgi:hydroxyjasmonate sulfotransferase
MSIENSFKSRPDDIILASNPKSGSTWLKALAFAVTSRSRYDLDNHPLLSRHPQDIVPFIEMFYPDKDLTHVETLPSPRLLSTHIPFSLLPESLVASGCRIVYLCREPKDVFVSWWHFDNKISSERKTDLEVAFSMFCEGCSSYGPFWDHTLEYWRQHIATPDRVLFMKYEDMLLEPAKYVISLAKFLGVPFSDKEQEDGVPEEVVRLCRFENLSSLETNQIGEVTRRGDVVIGRSAFFRKGKVGDWENHITQEMGRKLDRIVEEKLKGSGLVL